MGYTHFEIAILMGIVMMNHLGVSYSRTKPSTMRKCLPWEQEMINNVNHCKAKSATQSNIIYNQWSVQFSLVMINHMNGCFTDLSIQIMAYEPNLAYPNQLFWPAFLKNSLRYPATALNLNLVSIHPLFWQKLMKYLTSTSPVQLACPHVHMSCCLI